MSYTDQDVEEVINAYFMSYNASKNARGQTADASTIHRKAHEQGVRAARAALEAMGREPLEDVIDDLSPGTKISHVWPLREGGYEAEIGVPVTEHPDGWWDHEMFRGEGATIDAAIRNAVAAAKGEKA